MFFLFRYFLASFFFSLLFFCSAIKAELIEKINVIGNNRISSETIIIFSELRENQEINDNSLNEALKKLYKSNFFKNVSLLFNDGVLSIEVIENPIIENIFYNGVKSNNIREQILKELELKPRVSYNENLLESDKIKILSSLRNLGFYFSEVLVDVNQLDDNKININYDIKLNEKSKIKKITFLGDKIYKDSKLKNIIISEEYKFWKIISSKKYLNENLISLDTRLLKNFYLNNGYYNVDIASAFAKISDDDNFELIFTINPNNKIFFNEIELSLPDSFDPSHFSDLQIIFDKLKDQPYSIISLEKIINEIDKITLNEEYVSVKVNLNENIVGDKLNIDFFINEAEISYVNKINIFGNNITREDVFRNQFEIDEGDPFNEILYNKSLNNLKSLNFFQDVKSTVIETDDKNKIINITVEEKPTGEIMAGAGFGTSGGTAVFGIKENNYLGKGVSIDTNLSINSNTIKGIMSINNPNILNSDNSGYFSMQTLETDKLKDFGYKTNKTGFKFGTGFEYLDDLNLSIGSSTFFEKIETDSSASVRQKKQQGDYFDIFFTLNTDLDKRNKRFQTSDGFRSYYSLDMPLISDTNSMMNSYEFDYFLSLYENNISTFSFSLQNIFSISNDDVKLSERLYAPLKKLRGFEAGKVGPKDGNDFVGGNYFSSLNATTTLPQFFSNAQNTDFIIFFDAANLWGVDYDSSIDKSNKIRTSLGLGIDWFTPIGPLSFSISQPLTKSSTDVTETFRFNLGTTF